MTKRPDGDIPESVAAAFKRHGIAPELQARILSTSLLSYGRIVGLLDALSVVKDVPGDTAEIGVANGGTSLMIASVKPQRKHWACDTFRGLVDVCEHDTLTNGQFHNPPEKVAAVLGGLANVKTVAGYFPQSANYLMKRARFALVHIDVDTYTSIHSCFEWFAQRMAPGGVIVLDDVLERGCPGAIKAFAEIRQAKNPGWKVIREDMPPQAVVRFN